MTTRKAISTRTRFEVFKRDGFKCLYCGRTPPAVLLHVDHIIPVCGGGDNSRDNLATSCDKCNLGHCPGLTGGIDHYGDRCPCVHPNGHDGACQCKHQLAAVAR